MEDRNAPGPGPEFDNAMYLLNPMFVKFVLFSSKISWERISSTQNLVNVYIY